MVNQHDNVPSGEAGRVSALGDLRLPTVVSDHRAERRAPDPLIPHTLLGIRGSIWVVAGRKHQRALFPLKSGASSIPARGWAVLALAAVSLASLAAPGCGKTHRVPLPSGRAFNNGGIGTDGTYAYVSLRDQGPDFIGIDELRRYPLARIAEWGTPWIAE